MPIFILEPRLDQWPDADSIERVVVVADNSIEARDFAHEAIVPSGRTKGPGRADLDPQVEPRWKMDAWVSCREIDNNSKGVLAVQPLGFAVVGGRLI